MKPPLKLEGSLTNCCIQGSSSRAATCIVGRHLSILQEDKAVSILIVLAEGFGIHASRLGAESAMAIDCSTAKDLSMEGLNAFLFFALR